MMKTARHDGSESREIDAAIKGEAVDCDATTDMHAERTNLVRTDPHPRLGIAPFGRDSQIGQNLDDSLGHCSHVRADPVAQAKHRVSNELTMAMKGDVAAPCGLFDRDASHAKMLGCRHDILRIGVPAQRDDWLVFEQKQGFWRLSLLDLVADLLLEEQGPCIGHGA